MPASPLIRRPTSPRSPAITPSVDCSLGARHAVNVVILAAGQGQRMHSDTPKVLHALAGKPLLAHVIDAARELSPQRICVVYGHGGEAVREASAGRAAAAVPSGAGH